MATYNINGIKISETNDFCLACGTFEGSQYFLLRVFKRKFDGTSQFPFVIAPNGSGSANVSALDYANNNDVKLIINAGLFSHGGSENPNGTIIQNGVIIQDSPSSLRNLLTIDSNGDLSYVSGDADAGTLVANGIKSAVQAFAPLIINYAKTEEEDYPKPEEWGDEMQRQVIGQFGNGDYGILTIEGRDNDSSPGLPLNKVQDLLVANNFKFAFNLDGGGSTETVIGKKQLNTIYENATGRKVPTFIIFTGDTTFPA